MQIKLQIQITWKELLLFVHSAVNKDWLGMLHKIRCNQKDRICIWTAQVHLSSKRCFDLRATEICSALIVHLLRPLLWRFEQRSASVLSNGWALIGSLKAPALSWPESLLRPY